jgi:hypothetical protein
LKTPANFSKPLKHKEITTTHCAVCNILLDGYNDVLFIEDMPYKDHSDRGSDNIVCLCTFCYAASSADRLKTFAFGHGFLRLYTFMCKNRNYLSKARPIAWIKVLQYLGIMI